MTAPTMKVRVSFRTCRRGDEPAPVPKAVGRTSIARRVALAHHIENLIERGELRDYAEAAERLGLTRARVTQICDLALLAPDIQAGVSAPARRGMSLGGWDLHDCPLQTRESRPAG